MTPALRLALEQGRRFLPPPPSTARLRRLAVERATLNHCIVGALGSPRPFPALLEAVREDYGSIEERRLRRALAWLVARGRVARSGGRLGYVYAVRR